MNNFNKKIKLMEPLLGREELAAVHQVLESGVISAGEKGVMFGNMVAAYAGCEYGVAVSNCTAALHIALMVLGIGPGDEVMIPDYTHPATAMAVVAVGADPVLVDVDPVTFTLDFDKVLGGMSKRTKAIIPVSLFGYPVDIERYIELKNRFGVYVIEDAACSLGGIFNGVPSGSLADISCFSFHPRKIITSGEGGVLVTNNSAWAEKAKAIRQFGAVSVPGTTRMSFQWAGLNYKLSDVLAAIGLAQMEKLPRILEERRAKAKIYDAFLAGREGVIAPPYVGAGVVHTYQTYCCLLHEDTNRDELLLDLAAEGIECQIGTYSLHLQPYFSSLKRHGILGNSASAFSRSIALPLHSNLTLCEQERVCSALRVHLAVK